MPKTERKIKNPDFLKALQTKCDNIKKGCVVEKDGSGRLIRYGIYHGAVVEGTVIETRVPDKTQPEKVKEVYGDKVIGGCIGLVAYRGSTVEAITRRSEMIGEVYYNTIRPIPSLDELDQYQKIWPALKGLVIYEGRLLLLQRKNGEFDLGGALALVGKRFDERSLLYRSIRAATGLEVEVGEDVGRHIWSAKVKDETWQIHGQFFVCTSKTSRVNLNRDFKGYHWISPEEIRKYTGRKHLIQAVKPYIDQCEELTTKNHILSA